MKIALTVNGQPVTADVSPRTHLADFLRESLLLTGTHIGCEHGICGACTVEIDGEIARACITYSVACDGAAVRTIEGFDDDPLMERLRHAFTHAHALQCGYCTPGMLIAARDLVRRRGRLPARADIRREMSGNLCRCTGYQGIVDAIERVMAEPALVQATPHATPHGQAWLGPAPGPAARGATPTAPPVAAHANPARAAASPPAHATPLRGAKPTRPAIKVTVGQLEDAGGATRISQSFVLAHAREAVWALMSDIGRVARCLPGLALDGPPEGDTLVGRLEASIGPIRASFAGEAKLTRSPAEFRQRIEGSGGDRRSRSRAAGSLNYTLTAVPGDGGGEATRIDAVVTYTLAGPLAQFGRSGLVRDLVRRLGEAFAQNLDAQLRDPQAEMSPARLGGIALFLGLIADRLRALLPRLPGRRG